MSLVLWFGNHSSSPYNLVNGINLQFQFPWIIAFVLSSVSKISSILHSRPIMCSPFWIPVMCTLIELKDITLSVCYLSESLIPVNSSLVKDNCIHPALAILTCLPDPPDMSST